MAKNEEIGKLAAVNYNSETDDVSVVFKITDAKYKDFVLRWARAEEGRLVIRGDQLLYNETEGAMRASGRREHLNANV